METQAKCLSIIHFPSQTWLVYMTRGPCDDRRAKETGDVSVPSEPTADKAFRAPFRGMLDPMSPKCLQARRHVHAMRPSE